MEERSAEDMAEGKVQEKALCDLPEELLLSILDYLDNVSLCRIAQVSRHLRVLASCNGLWRRRAGKMIMTSSEGGLLQGNCPPFKEQYRVSKRWSQGRCKVQKVVRFEKNYLPWLAFDRKAENLFLAKGDSIKKYHSSLWLDSLWRQVSKESTLNKSFCGSCVVHQGRDVCRFQVGQKFIVTGGWHGILSWFTVDGKNIKMNITAHDSDISDVTSLDDVIISGSRDHSVKIWRLMDDGEWIDLLQTLPMHDKVLSLAMNKYKRIFAIGTGGLDGVHPLQVKDLASGAHLFSLGGGYRNGAGVLDCHFQSPETLMSAGYDTYVRLWDTRASTSRCVREWEEPHDNTVYCVTSDGRYGFVSGSCRHGVVRLWDARMRKTLQTFYLGGNVSSPVYSLRLTQTHLFAGLAQGVFSLDFR